MRKEKKEILKLTANEVLLSIFDLAVPFFEASSIYRIPAKKYLRERENDRIDFHERIRYLKRHGLIADFVEGKKEFIEITPKGLEKTKSAQFEITEIKRPEIWDGKWRIVIFDVPNKHSIERDTFRRKILKLGFQQIQRSVYVFPFGCTEEITLITNHLGITKYVVTMIGDIMQNETEIIDKFMILGVLNKNDLV